MSVELADIPITEELEELFIEILEVTCDMYLRQRFSFVGLPTTEQFYASPSGKDGMMETKPIRKRIEGYFLHADLLEPSTSKKVWSLVKNALCRLDMHAKSDLPQRIQSTLADFGLTVRKGEIVLMVPNRPTSKNISNKGTR